ncbi:MAG: glycoside hydrolase family 127 protein [Pirellulales bacterium]|nr:glycoside hydrolase family 127 protein [Pirellulales bacterium]
MRHSILAFHVMIFTWMCLCHVCSARDEEAQPVNLAVAATPSTSYVSGHETLAAINDGFDPRDSNDRHHGQYGNWPRRGTQWVQYEWRQPISTNRIDVYWWNDRQGVRFPTSCRLLYWDGDKFAPAETTSGLTIEKDKYSATTFAEITTTRLKLEMDGDGAYSTGILEWKVYDSGNSPEFPPRVTAGIDRVVVVGGKTHLDGAVQLLSRKRGSVSTRWSKESGPGNVSFADPNSLCTTASCSQPGDYVLKLNATAGDQSGSSTQKVLCIDPPPAEPLCMVDMSRYTIDNPLWNDRAKALIVHWIPHCIRKINDPDLREGGINNFLEAAQKLAGEPHEAHRGYVFSNAWVYNTIEAMCFALMVDPRGDPEILDAQQQMRSTLEDWIPKVLAAQEPDGYIQTAFTLSDRQRWSPRHRGDHEGYVAGYFLDAAAAHYQQTGGGDKRLYNAAKKLADCWDEQIGPSPKQAWYDGHQAMEMALFRFGRLVGDVEGGGKGDKYLALGKFLLDCRKDGSEYDQSHVPVTQQYEAVGHAVRASYSYTGMADVVLATGDIDYQSAVMSLWNSIVHRKYYVTGGIGSGETSEGFGPDYSLRHNAYCESCSSCGEVQFQHRLCLIHHDAKYADLYEETLYNALLGSIDLAGEKFYYQNPLDERRPRYEWHGCPCCVGNIPLTLLMLPTWTYARDDQNVYINLFIGGSTQVGDVAGTQVGLTQRTDYPWGGDVSITVNPESARTFGVRIRSPRHSVSDLYTCSPESDGIASISVNGQTITPPIEKGYVVVHRKWKAGDRIDLTLPMKAQRVKGVDKIEATRDRVALRRGPLIYAVEEVDQDPDAVLSSTAELKAEWRADLLHGTVVLTSVWSDQSALMAIPYYLRNNRKPSSLSRVWIRDGE